MGLRAGLAVGGVLAVLAWGAWQYRAGWTGKADRIEEQNEEAGNAADQAELDFRKCIDRGGVYDFAAGRCAGADAGGGG